MVSLAHPLDLPNFKTSMIENSPQLKVWLSAGNCMNDPFYFCQTIQPGISFGKRCQRYQHALASVFDLGKLDDQSV